MKLGVHIGQQNMTFDEMRELWKRLDVAGVDWISLWDHLYEAPPAGGTIPHFEALTALGAMAADTTHARLGCLVFYVGYRNPSLIAKAAATLDHISGGRFELGIGAGWHQWEAIAYGYDFPGVGERLDMLDEAAHIIRGMLTRERTTFQGKHFRVEDVSCLPMPVQQRLPLWIGGVGEKKTLKIVAQHADGWNAAYVPPERYQQLNNRLTELCEQINRDPAEIIRSVNVAFNLSTDAASAEKAEQELIAAWGPAAERMKGGALMGSPEQAIEHVLAYRDAGAEQLNIAMRAPWDEAALEAWIETVIPAIRAETG
ncbi:MAG: TIGR03560 family F420-dependent LLM class oxidoreductase [Pseudomonadota bacterium]